MWSWLKFNNLGIFCLHQNEGFLKVILVRCALGESDRKTFLNQLKQIKEETGNL